MTARPLFSVPFFIVVVAVLPALLVASPASAQSWLPPLGPLTAEEGAPLQRLGYTPAIERTDVVPRGTFRTDLWLGYANIFEQDSSASATLFLDLERLVTAATVRYGLHDRLEVGARATFETTWGGFLDPVILTFHWGLLLGNRERPHFPENAYGQTLEDASGRVLVSIPQRAFALEDVRLFAKWQAYDADDGRRALSVRALSRIPTQDNLIGDERADVGLMVLGRTAWGRWHLHGMVGGSTVRRSPELTDVLRSRQWFAMAGLERPIREGLSAVIEWTGSTQLLRGFGDFDVDGAPTNVVLGAVGVTKSGWRWEIAMQEDFPPRGPSIDFTVQVALGKAW